MGHKLIVFLYFIMICACNMANAEGITSYERLLLPSYWTSHNPNGDNIIMDAQAISNLNASIRGISRTVVHMGSYPETIDGNSLKTKITNYQVLEDDLYLNGRKVSDNYKNILRIQTNVSKIPATINVRYGVTVRRTNVRNLPTGQGLFYYAEDTEFDSLQETVLDPCEPVAILHTSANGYFYYVQAYNYSGWVKKFDVALTNKANWMQYVNPTMSLVVVDKKIDLYVPDAKESIVFQQGARIPLLQKADSKYLLKIPIRLADGNLKNIQLGVPVTQIASKISEGYMRYTSNNVINAVFKNYNEPYGWGGLKDSVDCSSMIANVYRIFGIILPRNADEQALSAGRHYNFDGLDREARLSYIRNLLPGAVLHMDGHCEMYLGKSNNVPFVLHSLGSYYKNGERYSVMKVILSDLELCRSNGKTHLMELISAIEYK